MTGGSACGEARYAVTAQPIFGYDLPLHDLPEENWQRLLNERAGSTPEYRPQAVKDDNSLPEDRVGNVDRQHFCEDCLVRSHTEPAAHSQAGQRLIL